MALTIPGRVLIGRLVDRFGPRVVYSALLALAAIPVALLGTVQTFGRDMKAAYPGIKTKQPRDDGKRLRVYEGIGLI